MVTIPFAAGDNVGAIDKRQENYCVILEAAAGIPGGEDRKENHIAPGLYTPGTARNE